jgi:hypothetical protein
MAGNVSRRLRADEPVHAVALPMVRRMVLPLMRISNTYDSAPPAVTLTCSPGVFLSRMAAALGDQRSAPVACAT